MSVAQTNKPVNFFLALFASYIIFVSGYVIDQTLTCTSQWVGFINGVRGSVLFILIWPIYVFPLNLLVFFLYRWLRLSKWRTLFLLLPSILFFGYGVVGMVAHPPFPRDRFRQETGLILPASVKDLESYLGGGGLIDYRRIYYFHCDAVDTAGLIKALNLKEDSKGMHPYEAPAHYIELGPPRTGWPNPKTWLDAKLYDAADSEKGWYFTLITDGSASQVYLFVDAL